MSHDVSESLAAYHKQGFVILRGLLSPAELAELRGALAPYLETGAHGRNNFEGEKTQRVYSLVGRGKPFEATAEHPAVLALLDELLETNYLLTASQAIRIYPGETPQPIHFDDKFYPIPRPRPAISVSTVWAVDDFTAENGATEAIPGSHMWSDEEVAGSFQQNPDIELPEHYRALLEPVEMPAGSCVVFAGTLLHRGGQNTSAGPRTAFSHQYCQPWARQQENYFLSVPSDRTAAMSPRLRRLLGYSIHPPFMGQVAGRHPDKVLQPGYRNSLEVDDELISDTE